MTGKTKYLYWFRKEELSRLRELLRASDLQLRSAVLTPCQALKAAGTTVMIAAPGVWTRICTRQATWYRESPRCGQYMVMSEARLPEELDGFLDAELSQSDFSPEKLPSSEELEALVESEEYQNQKPDGWESIGWTDSLVFKLLFTATRFWGKGDSLERHWLSHKSNHANFLARTFTTRLEGEDVAYSVTENAGICSSCAEFFNVVEPESRKLVRSCPGSVIFGGAPRNTYLDVQPAAAPLLQTTEDEAMSGQPRNRREATEHV